MSGKPSRVFLVVGNDVSTEHMLLSQGHTITKVLSDNFDCAFFLGGEDVHPFLYGEKPIKQTQPNWNRDLVEIGIYKYMHKYKPKVGVCRGGQFLNVMSGGVLWQHVTNHMSSHEIQTNMGEVITVPSDHHQMMWPSPDAWELAWAKEAFFKTGRRQSIKYSPEKRKQTYDDVEAVYYPDTHSLCVQYHPEYETAKGPARDMFFHWVEEYLFAKEVV